MTRRPREQEAVEWESDICVLLRNLHNKTVQAATAQHIRRSALQPLWNRKRDSNDYKAIMEGGKHPNQEAPVRRSASPSEIIQIEALYEALGQKRILRRSAAVTKAGGGAA